MVFNTGMLFLAVIILIVGQPSPTVAARDSLLEATASEILAMYKAGTLSPSTYVQHLINHTKKNENRINAFISFNPERVLAQTKTTQKYRRHQQCLNGLPIAVKDNIDVRGYPTTSGTPALRDALPRFSGPVVRHLISAGAVIFGKTNMHELQLGITSNNTYFGPVHNPWNISLIPGGSSGGSVASVSARFTPIALCGDTVASCRLPAALSGIVGFRPSIGRYSAKRVTPTSLTLDTIGINARSVEDVVLIDGVLTNGSCDRKPAPLTLSTIRLGFDRTTFLKDVDPDLHKVFNKSIETLVNAGVQIIPIDFSKVLALDQATSSSIYFYDFLRDLGSRLRVDFKHPVPLADVLAQVASPDVKAIITGIQDGTLTVSKEKHYSALNVGRAQLQCQLQTFFDSLSLNGIIFPTVRLTARPIGQDPVIINNQPEPTFNAYLAFQSFGATAGVPGISIPIGLTQETKLPVGMEIEGPYGKDEELLDVAAALLKLFEPLPTPTDVLF